MDAVFTYKEQPVFLMDNDIYELILRQKKRLFMGIGMVQAGHWKLNGGRMNWGKVRQNAAY